jgi:hypothetical protein
MYVDLSAILKPAGVYGEAEVSFTYSPGTPDVWYMPNGDPGYPGEPPEVDIDTVVNLQSRACINKILTNKQWGDIEDYLNENYEPSNQYEE